MNNSAGNAPPLALLKILPALAIGDLLVLPCGDSVLECDVANIRKQVWSCDLNMPNCASLRAEVECDPRVFQNR